MKLSSTHEISSIKLSGTSNAPIVLSLEWGVMRERYTSTLTISHRIAQEHNITLASVPFAFECVLGLEHLPNPGAQEIEERTEIVCLEFLSHREIISRERTKEYVAYFESPEREGTIQLGSFGGVIHACPRYELYIPLTKREYESLSGLLLGASRGVWFALTFRA